MGNKKESFTNEKHMKGLGLALRDIILGGQDGLVNVLGLVLGVAAATASTPIVLIAAIAGAMAESISMAAVAYTSTKASWEHYRAEVKREKKEIRETPELERQEIKEIYAKKGFKGKLLDAIVRKITSRKKLWIDTMMMEELKLLPSEYESPRKAGIRVGIATIIGSSIPIVPFFFVPVKAAIIAALVISVSVLFVTGALKARLTLGSWKKEGFELAAIGTAAALAGYLVGLVLSRFMPV